MPRTITDCRHEHELTLTNQPYIDVENFWNKEYECDHCGRTGYKYSYHCALCHWDLHPGCQLTHSTALFNDPRHIVHRHTFNVTSLLF